MRILSVIAVLAAFSVQQALAYQCVESEGLPDFDFNPEGDGSIDTTSAGYAYTRTGAATTVTLVSSLYGVTDIAENAPRYVDHPTMGSGLWCEFDGTNLLTRSEEFDDAAWDKNGAMTITADAAASAEHAGNVTADLLNGDGTDSYNCVRQQVGADCSQCFVSVWAKAGTVSWLRIHTSVDGSFVGGSRANFNLDDQSTGITASISGSGVEGPYVNGYYRYWIQINLLANYYVDFCPGIANDDAQYESVGGDIYLWGANAEIGSANVEPMSYIPTAGTTADRGTDRLSYDWPGDASLPFGTTIVADVFPRWWRSGLQPWDFVELHDGTTSNRVAFRVNISIDNKPHALITAGGTQVAALNAADTAHEADHVFAVSALDDDFELFKDSVSQATDTAGAMPSGFTTVSICDNETGDGNAHGVVHRAYIYHEAGLE